ncbi:MarR family winged helix-turn-helix transcriptional regulator [Longimicrobium sp.]|uniref:MarR family winged helix-turn-helix transcriptional regulator n=1 Tax=Longimicrobium sp. TaxID=2029185 RepID=UPI002E2F8CD2|nr:MarR family winged helix-turn-helix transcriptional regulator [Longimicrobium sp.]HEX6040978.1 MarR family winged helix-turn-helix transcriptional regulator [Longimicrobium sp.]
MSERRQAETTKADADEALAAIERAFVRIRRGMSRRNLGARMMRELGGGVDLSHMGVVDAVEEGPDAGGGPVTVGMVGERMGIDPSRASRVVASALEAGYVERVASQADGRRVGLRLTDAGRALAESARAVRRRAFAEAMDGWPDADRRDFARLLSRFVGRE